MSQNRKEEIIQCVDAHPEIPGGMKLNRDDRKKMAEIMLGYPPRTEPKK